MSLSLPADYYVDPQVFAKERRYIFSRAWWLLGPERQVSEPDQYIADTICGWPVFVIRTKSGQLKGYHNVCRHRGSPLLEAGTGCQDELRCPYHGWLYDSDGRLLKAPRFGASAELVPENLSLFPIRVECWNGLVFVAVDESIPTLREWLGAGYSLCEPYPTTSELDFFGEFTIDGDANWKSYCDNTGEGYHLNLVHPRLGESLRGGNVEIKPYDDGKLVAFHVAYSTSSHGGQLRGAHGLWFYRFPGFQIVAGKTGFKAERVEPIGAGKFRSRNWAWYGGLSETERKDAFDWSAQIVREDLGICERVQKNFEAGVYQCGPLSPNQESNTARFQALVREALSAADDDNTHAGPR